MKTVNPYYTQPQHWIRPSGTWRGDEMKFDLIHRTQFHLIYRSEEDKDE